MNDEEFLCLRLKARGLTAREVAKETGLSERQVNYRLANVYSELDADCTAAAVKNAEDRGLVFDDLDSAEPGDPLNPLSEVKSFNHIVLDEEQMTILTALGKGDRARKIALDLNLKRRYVDDQITKLIRLFGCRDRVVLCRLARSGRIPNIKI
ncbi:MAG TPA: LuxR C-terminal-related transcriptional regulator [Candidatus Saccharimonadales bacterium]|nr:LuxR C-terminal-related transcriptional regulator [Candidatus Saccharimonadales bacterium]